MRAGADGEEQRPGLQGCAEQALQAGGDHGAGAPSAAGPAENTFQAGEAGDQVLGGAQEAGEGLRGRAGAWGLSRRGL